MSVDDSAVRPLATGGVPDGEELDAGVREMDGGRVFQDMEKTPVGRHPRLHAERLHCCVYRIARDWPLRPREHEGSQFITPLPQVAAERAYLVTLKCVLSAERALQPMDPNPVRLGVPVLVP